MPRSQPDPAQKLHSSEDLPGDETSAIYLTVLQQQRVTHENLNLEGYSDEEIATRMPILEARGLVRRLHEGLWDVISPDVALPAFAARLEERARTLRSSAPNLTRVYLRSQSESPISMEGVTRITRFGDLALAVQQILAAADSSVWSLRNSSPFTRYQLAADTDRLSQLLLNGRGHRLTMRAVWDLDLVSNHPGALRMMKLRAEAGDTQRIAPRVPFTAMINDRGSAILDFEDDAGAPSAIVLSPGSGTEAMERLMDLLWRLSMPWQPNTPTADNPESLSKRDRQILRLMAGGTTDAAIARQLSISPRTVERRVRAIMDQLNAATRFQAGVLAQKRDLL